MIPESETRLCRCERCGVPCRVAAHSNPDARPLRHSTKPEGFCVNCGVTAFFQHTEPLPELIATSGGPECLRLDHIREQFEQILRVGMADAKADEIDWEKVIADWSLPFPKRRGKGKGRKKGGG
jgi:hypothetical protein